MKKLIWLFAVLICVLGFSFVACGNPDNGGSGNSSYSDDGSDYGLGEYENENDKQWWDSNFVSPDDSSSENDNSSNENDNSSSESNDSSNENNDPSSEGNPEDGDFDIVTRPY